MSEYTCPKVGIAIGDVLVSSAVCVDCPMRELAQKLDQSTQPITYSQYAAYSLTVAVEALEALDVPEPPETLPEPTVQQQIDKTLGTLTYAANRKHVRGSAIAKAINGCIAKERTRLPQRLG